MYPEFIGIYAGLLVNISLQIVIMILLLKRTSKRVSAKVQNTEHKAADSSRESVSSDKKVLCTKCSEVFNASERVCPKCGTPR